MSEPEIYIMPEDYPDDDQWWGEGEWIEFQWWGEGEWIEYNND